MESSRRRAFAALDRRFSRYGGSSANLDVDGWYIGGPPRWAGGVWVLYGDDGWWHAARSVPEEDGHTFEILASFATPKLAVKAALTRVGDP